MSYYAKHFARLQQTLVKHAYKLSNNIAIITREIACSKKYRHASVAFNYQIIIQLSFFTAFTGESRIVRFNDFHKRKNSNFAGATLLIGVPRKAGDEARASFRVARTSPSDFSASVHFSSRWIAGM